jgi:hypothetical protein
MAQIRMETMISGFVGKVPQVLHKYRDKPTPDAVFVGRPSKWGNPFVIGKDGTRDDVVAKYRSWVGTQPHLLNALDELRGKDLICFCAPENCHGLVLLELANKRQSFTPYCGHKCFVDEIEIIRWKESDCDDHLTVASAEFCPSCAAEWKADTEYYLPTKEKADEWASNPRKK